MVVIIENRPADLGHGPLPISHTWHFVGIFKGRRNARCGGANPDLQAVERDCPGLFYVLDRYGYGQVSFQGRRLLAGGQLFGGPHR